MKTIGLCMIVRNEAHVILRCLESVQPLVDYVLIEDTGSTDGTQQIVRNYLHAAGIPGEVVEQPWRDFACNRSSALAHLRRRAEIDYALIMDADDVLVYAEDFDAARFKAALAADLYNVWIRLGAFTYHRPQICSNRVPFRYRGVLHEFLEAPGNPSLGEATGLTILVGREGARSQAADKYQRDAALLEQALTTEQDAFLIARYTFYLAQSYRDAAEIEKALPLYLRRAEQGYWDQEIFISLYEAAKIQELLHLPDSQVIGLFLKAYEVCPSRAESLHGAMRYCRTHGKYHQGFLIGKHAVTISRPAGGLFLEEWIYDYGLFDEFSVLAYWSGHYAECRDYAARILEERKIAPHERERIARNLHFASERIQSTEVKQRPAAHDLGLTRDQTSAAAS
jgi:glycosyltransferase involved in cell wall biosynthesis